MAESYFDKFLTLAQGVATPLVQRAVYGKEAASEMAMRQEANYYGRLNGSGPIDRYGALQQPQSLLDKILGNPFDRNQRGVYGGNLSIGLLLIALAIVLLFMWRRRS